VAKRQDARISKTAADVVVPFARLDELTRTCRDTFAALGLDGAIWGHISDGNLHPNVVPRTFTDVERGREAIHRIGAAAIALDGCPLAEHGVGRNPLKKALMARLHGAVGIESMRAVKRALDPCGLLAPGVLIDI
jgi:FAD/FMN-containing dehydrogenase